MVRSHLEYFPAAQVPVAAVRPSVSQYEPFTHGKHAVAPMLSWYWPLGHKVQSFATYTSSSAIEQLCDAPAGVNATNFRLSSVDSSSNSTICQASLTVPLLEPAIDHFCVQTPDIP